MTLTDEDRRRLAAAQAEAEARHGTADPDPLPTPVGKVAAEFYADLAARHDRQLSDGTDR